MLKNTGSVAGAEVAQVYLTYPSTANEPQKQLKGFKKIMLGVGVQVKVDITLSAREYAIWNVNKHGWERLEGEYRIDVGASSCDLRLSDSILFSST